MRMQQEGLRFRLGERGVQERTEARSSTLRQKGWSVHMCAVR